MTKAKEVMTNELCIVEPDATLQTAAKKMKAHDVGVLPVISSEGRAVGMITDRDIAVRAVAEGHDPNLVSVKDVMSNDVEFCYEDDNIEQVARLMGEKKLHRIMVVNRGSNGIRGILSLGDLSARSDSRKMVGAVLAECTSS